MLLLDEKLVGVPVMSLQTGAELARTTEPVIDPRNLTIVAFFVDGSQLDERPSVLHVSDIRESGKLGFIVDDAHSLMPLEGLIRLEEVLGFRFRLLGHKVIDTTHATVGTVSHYTFEPAGFTVQQIHVKQPFFKSFASAARVIHRTQIVSITSEHIIVEAPTVTEDASAPVESDGKPAFVNPFSKPQPEPVSHPPASA